VAQQKYRVATSTGATVTVTAETPEAARAIVVSMRGRQDAQRRVIGDPTTVTPVPAGK
jgi:hypothetical protein